MELIGGWTLPFPALLVGIITGLAYGLLAAALVLVYRSSKVINFAQAAIGALVALLFGISTAVWRMPYWLAFPIALMFAAGIGGLAEVALVRRLRRAPPLISLVATLGFAEVLLALGMIATAQVRFSDRYPHPPGIPPFRAGSLVLSPSEVALLVLAPAVMAALGLCIRRSRIGLAIRAAASNAERSELVGLSPRSMSTLSWAIAASLSGFGAIFLFPGRGFVAAASFGPLLILRALVPAVLSRMHSIPTAFAWGIVVGIVEQTILWNQGSGAFLEVALFGLILFSLPFLRPSLAGSGPEPGWLAVEPWPPLPPVLSGVWIARNLGKLAALAGLALAVLVPALAPHNAAIVFSSIVAFALVGLSVGIVTGLSGQLSLGQFALAGIGGAVAYHVVASTGSLPLAAAEGGIAAAAAAVILGAPALRVRGPMLAVTTLSFSLAASAWLFHQPWMLGDGVDPRDAEFFGIRLADPKAYYFAALTFLVIGVWLVANIRSRGLGRCLVAIRDNERAARAFSVPATLRRLQGFALGGFLAGVGGAVYAQSLSRISSAAFSPADSISVVAMAAIGGVGLAAGPLIGALYIIGVPAFIPLDSAGLAASSLGWLLLVLYFPGGLPQLFRPVRARLLGLFAKNEGVRIPTNKYEPVFRTQQANGPGETPRASASTPDAPTVLKVTGITKTFGGINAVEDLSTEIHRGETAAIVGPNGAGKTTLLEIVSGFIKPDEGRIEFKGRSLTTLAPEARARRGIVRSFQGGLLFPSMLVTDVLKLAQERTRPSSFFPSCLGIPERQKQKKADELIQIFALGDFRNDRISDLSTGVRRVVEIACMVALEPELLLLDEPSAGIAQKETERLADLLISLKRDTQATLVVVEHNLPLVTEISDRVLCMDAGKLISSGPPAHFLAIQT